MKKKIYIRTFGCQMNEHDSAKIILMLARYDFVATDKPEDADLILFNTCTIREKAHHKAMSEIGRSKVYKQRRPGAMLGVCGCVAQEDKEAIFKRYPHIDIMFGPDQIHKLPDLLDEAKKNGKSAALDLIDDQTSYVFLNEVPEETAKSPTAFVSIMKGCNCACSYCIVPTVRGREVDRSADDVIKEIISLTGNGAREVVLLGQNVNSYKDSDKAKNGFVNLIRRISLETPVDRIRFMSPHPKDVNEDLIREYKENEKLMPHIHLPVQAGSNAMLKKMRRGYTREHYMEITDALRSLKRGISITTDIIVGFCGETEKDFEGTLDLIRHVEFDSAFAFKYSPRPDTEAFKKFKDDVPQEDKETRLDQVLKLELSISKRKNESLIGMVFKALATGFDRMNRGLVTGRLPDNRIVHFAGNLSHVGNIVPVRIVGAHANSLAGEVII